MSFSFYDFSFFILYDTMETKKILKEILCQEEVYDITIVGGGPVGLFAAFYNLQASQAD